MLTQCRTRRHSTLSASDSHRETGAPPQSTASQSLPQTLNELLVCGLPTPVTTPSGSTSGGLLPIRSVRRTARCSGSSSRLGTSSASFGYVSRRMTRPPPSTNAHSRSYSSLAERGWIHQRGTHMAAQLLIGYT